jgi:iron-sulfur cluster assembly protein
MNMTAEGRRYIEEVVAASKHRTLRFYGVSACCGTSLGVALEEAQEGDEVNEVGGIMLAIDPIVKPLLEGVSLHAKEQYGELSLVLEGYTPASI